MKNKTYSVSVKVIVDTQIDLSAKNYEEALQKARELGVKDVVEFDTDYNDGSISVTGVYNYEEAAHK